MKPGERFDVFEEAGYSPDRLQNLEDWVLFVEASDPDNLRLEHADNVDAIISVSGLKPFIPHEPVKIGDSPLEFQETTTADLEGAQQACLHGNIIEALDRMHRDWSQSHPLYVIQPDAQHAVGSTLVDTYKYGGRLYTAEDTDVEPLLDANVPMIEEFAKRFGCRAEPLIMPPKLKPGEVGALDTRYETVKYQLDNGWSVEMIVTSRQASQVYGDWLPQSQTALPQEKPSVGLNIWLCPPSRGVDEQVQLVDKPDVHTAVKQAEADVARTWADQP